MAKVILNCIEPSLNIEQKILSLREGIPLRIGRGHQNELILNCNGLLPQSLFLVSYHHASISFFEKEFYIRDTSRNGTFINGYKLNKGDKCLICSGDVIQFSSSSFSSAVTVKCPSFIVKLFQPDDANFKYMSLLQELYGSTMQFFKEFPNLECNLEVLHLYVRERLQVLQILDGFGYFVEHNKMQFIQFLNALKQKELHHMMKLITGTSESFKEELFLQKLDHISHYMLCISCCKNYVLKKWFIDQEMKLLQIRWHFLLDHERNEILLAHFYKEKVSEEQITELEQESNGYLNLNIEYYKIPMERVSSLIRTRNVFMKIGFCFIPKKDMIDVLMNDLMKTMKINLEIMHKNLHNIWHDERITSIIHYIMKEIKFERYLFDHTPGSSVMLSDIDKFAAQSFPLCMNELHYNLKKHHHLRNSGRHQYGLFLKALGLSLQDSIAFWRHYFTKKMSLDEFLKNYHYHILHSYGVVGKMANYPPQSCKKILQAVPSFDEYHGCPFKVLDNSDIVPLLERNGIDDEGIQKILERMGQGMPQLACKVYFEFKHNCDLPEAPYHPNRYFDASREIVSNNLASSSKCSLRNKRQTLKGECAKDLDW